MRIPPVRYFETDGAPVAYQTVGDGPTDILFLPPIPHNLDVQWEQPRIERFLRRLASFARVIQFDWVGGAVDLGRWSGPNEKLNDLLVRLLDEVAAEQAVVVGIDPPATGAAWYAAAYPERVASLVLIDPAPRFKRADDYPYGMPDSVWLRWVEYIGSRWGTGELLVASRPGVPVDEQTTAWFAKYERATFSPVRWRGFVEGGGWWDIDLRGVLSSIRCPTLIITHRQHSYIRPEHGRYMAEHISDCRLVERDGPYGAWWLDDVDATLDEIENFVTGQEHSTASADRVLATVLFTDIVGSTERAAALGDARWRLVLDLQSSVFQRQLDRYNGRLVKTLGDGLLATFDGPARAIRCGLDIRDEMRSVDIDIRTGVHTGEIERLGDDIGGLAVHVGARVMSAADPGGVMVTSIVKDLVAGSGIAFEDRGLHELKGVPDALRLYAVSA
jgi:class 3 adenylate cyclase